MVEHKDNSVKVFKRVYLWYINEILQEGYIIDMPDGSKAVVHKQYGDCDGDGFPWGISQLDESWCESIESLIEYECNKLRETITKQFKEN